MPDMSSSNACPCLGAGPRLTIMHSTEANDFF
ncbi:hypothetical protein GCK32_022622 [Trichostrongylus colubriformis]|uniref:Uncharacterized protein n=1 Tax=Trichostrongylus colubriformis TaxID=6319 RepID=A0AAN8IUE2_TRICO